jgi:3-oxoacyl-[acyl-carrier-protein] synthase II
MSMANPQLAMANTGPARDPVSLCGIGAVTGYGWGHKLLIEGLLSGESAARPTPGFSPYFEEDVVWVAPVEDGGDPADGPTRYQRAVRYAAREAVHNAEDRGWRPGGVVGMITGYVLGDVDGWRSFHHRHGLDASKREWLGLMPSTVLSGVAQEFGFHGPNMAVTAMCASTVAGLLTAQMWIAAGLADDVLVLSVDLSITPENCAAFNKLGALFVDRPSLETCRPFQEGSRGFTAGEAAVGFMVSGRPAGRYANILGGAMTHDGYHAISIDPNHEQVMAAFAGAVRDSGIHANDVTYVNAHGTGTAQCDAAEASVLDTLFPAAEGIYSMKPLTGHCQGAAGGVELTAALYGLERGVIPAPPRVAKGHPRLLDGPTACVEGPILKSSLGMGGHNAVVALEAAPA